MKLVDEVKLTNGQFNFYQEKDSCDSGSDGQNLKVLVKDAGAGK